MSIQDTFYLFGIIFFSLWFVFLIVMIIAAVMAMRGVKEVKETTLATLEENRRIGAFLPMIGMMLYEGASLWKRVRR